MLMFMLFLCRQDLGFLVKLWCDSLMPTVSLKLWSFDMWFNDDTISFIIWNQRAETDWLRLLVVDEFWEHAPFTVCLDSAMNLVSTALVLVLVMLVVGQEHAEVEHQEQDDGGGEAECGHDQPLLELHDCDCELVMELWTSVDSQRSQFRPHLCHIAIVCLLTVAIVNWTFLSATGIAFALKMLDTFTWTKISFFTKNNLISFNATQNFNAMLQCLTQLIIRQTSIIFQLCQQQHQITAQLFFFANHPSLRRLGALRSHVGAFIVLCSQSVHCDHWTCNMYSPMSWGKEWPGPV